ncbi:trx [Scenedesmus sp. PABB004]|nr:trx [Scenedesmus sp. PABB004]
MATTVLDVARPAAPAPLTAAHAPGAATAAAPPPPAPHPHLHPPPLAAPPPAAAGGAPSPAAAAAPYPAALGVICNGSRGTYFVDRGAVQCRCRHCAAATARGTTRPLMSPTEYERHTGMTTAKKWRVSVRVAHEGQPEVPLGRWLEAQGLTHKTAGSTSGSPEAPPGSSPRAGGKAAAAPDERGARDQPQQDQAARPQQHAAPQQQPPAAQPRPAGATELLPPCVRRVTPEQAARSALAVAAAAAAGLRIDVSGPVEVVVMQHPGVPRGGAAPRRDGSPPGRRAADSGSAAGSPASRAAAEAAAAAAAAAAGAAAGRGFARPRRPPGLLQIPVAPEPPAAALCGSEPVPLEEAAAAAARGDDSLWLRSPVRRTPRSTRGGPGGPEAAAAETFRRLVSGLPPGPGAAGGGGWPRGGGGEDDEDMDEGDEPGIAVGPDHQAELPLLRTLPPLRAAAALLELRKAGRAGPPAAVAAAIAVEEKARSDLLPRDAVEDVWERHSSTGVALQRAQRHKKPPGWQAGFVDPLKPYTLAGGHPGGALPPAEAGDDGSDGARARKRGGRDEPGSSQEAEPHAAKRPRCTSGGGARRGPGRRGSADGAAGGSGGPHAPCCADPLCPGNAKAAAAAVAGPLPPAGWAVPGLFRAAAGPELLSWLLLPPAAAAGAEALAADADATAPAPAPAPAEAPAGEDDEPAAAPVKQEAPTEAQEAPAGAAHEAPAAEAAPAAASAAAPPAAEAAPSAPAAAAAPPAARGAVEVRIVLDGCVFVGQLAEVGRLEMARSRLGAAVEPVTPADTHAPPPRGATCALCHAPEAPGCHADQATAVPATGMSRTGLGPLMPVTMPVHAPAAGAAEGGGGEGAAGEPAPAPAPAAVAWVHRQCALWSPEVYPDRRGALMHLAGAIARGRAARCSACGRDGATLKCADRSCTQHFHLPCARQAGWALIAEPYTVTCPAHVLKPAELAHKLLAAEGGAGALEPRLRCRTGVRRDGAGATPPGSARAGDDDAAHGDSDATPSALEGEADEYELSAAAVLSAFKRRGGQSRLRRQSHSQDWANNHQRQGSPAAADGGNATPPGGALRARGGGVRPGARAGARGSGPPGGLEPGPDDDGHGSDASAGTPPVGRFLGGTTGQPGRAGRCAVCVVQRKGKCGTDSAPKKCLRRQIAEHDDDDEEPQHDADPHEAPEPPPLDPMDCAEPEPQPLAQAPRGRGSAPPAGGGALSSLLAAFGEPGGAGAPPSAGADAAPAAAQPLGAQPLAVQQLAAQQLAAQQLAAQPRALPGMAPPPPQQQTAAQC